LGRSRPLTDLRREYFPRQEILDEVLGNLALHQPGDIDWVTIVGSGEPTLYDGLGWLIRRIKGLIELPVAVITNGARLFQPEIRGELSSADAVLPSLDAGDPRLYKKINRPWPKLTFERFLHGLISFRQEFTGQLWVEVMLVKGLNDSVESLQGVAAALEKVQPDQVHLLLPTRPPAESWVQPSDASGLQRAQDILGAVAPVMTPDSTSGIAVASVANNNDLELAILGIIRRHPMQETELQVVLNACAPAEIHLALKQLLAAHKVQVIERYEKLYWTSSESFYNKS
jgi:wyosine [tRNA(Phe)-imidazoG37] synthetase (radical SAM superfamily)